MAYIWHLTANCGTEEFAKQFAKHFDLSPFSVPHAGDVELRTSVEHNDSGWEVHVLPYVRRRVNDPAEGRWHLNDHGGATTPEEVADIDACAKVLYDRLAHPLRSDSQAPFLTFQFVLTGFEVGDWRSPGGLLDDLSPGGLYLEQRAARVSHAWDGLVISRPLYEAAMDPPGLVRFGPGYYWIPFTSIEKSQ